MHQQECYEKLFLKSEKFDDDLLFTYSDMKLYTKMLKLVHNVALSVLEQLAYRWL